MAIAQSDFTLWRDKAYEGQISTTDICEVISRRVETEMVPFGRAVIRGAGIRSCAPVTPTTMAAQIIGFTVRSMAEFSNSVPTNPPDYDVGYGVDHVASLLRKGPMFVLCVNGANAGDAVTVITARGDNQGRLTAGGIGVKLDFVCWVDDVVAGEIGEVRVDGIFASTTASGSGAYCQEAIEAGIQPGNADATIAAKGSATPLINHGMLKGVITHIVED
ncbi:MULTISPECIES: structural cement protein Gp24 [Yersinia pseudotuberculosis complex]|uniref:Uncharacterized protein n=2 Tax=Yersinia pseudotuberculosis complex TaxID=1649845 RepID=A0A0U1R395_YERP3|nr:MULTISPECIES: hypothetical protein [Yersinia pseudotuberculosis complex]ABS49795.1 hypothetical protein YpsIP31758_2221 [Yersinia pseudotuberculosis IP 31758]AJK15056.1 hypothetical protein BZ19_1206 [Yersinia pseudotuberculosis str. PA3606]MCE4113776.1 hypothetical protein [Yersinia pseudotuberculosis]MCF1165034.1 hypothetical protein [Yersinia pseudotuberculosis]UFA61896.1 Uncharacterized protein YP598_2278 [Yersinia pseudotuberculosis]